MPPNEITPPAPPRPPVIVEARATLPGEAHTKQADTYMQMVTGYVIDSPDTLQAGADDRNEINARHKELEKQRQILKEPMLEGGRRIDAFFKPILEALEGARKIIDRKIAAYTEEQERIRREAERKAREEQERAAAAQRAAAAKAEADARAKADELRRQAEAAAAKGRAGEAAKLAEKAASTEAAGVEKAQTLNTEAEITASTPVVIAAAAPKAEGVSMSYTYGAEVTDKQAFLQHILNARPDLLALVTFDQAGLNRQAASLKEALNLPGVKLVKKPKVSGR